MLIAAMVIPAMVKGFPDLFVLDIPPLKGYIVLSEEPEFSWETWFEGSFQTGFNAYMEDHIGFRNLFVRFYNQVDFWLFREVHAAVIMGKNDCLYEENYILAYTGKDYLGDSVISQKCEKIKFVQEELEKLNTELVIVLAPGKAGFFPDYIPDRYLTDPIATTNNEAYLDYFEDSDISHIDFHTLFNRMKDTSAYPLYHKCGIHWSTYGAYYAIDSMVK